MQGHDFDAFTERMKRGFIENSGLPPEDHYILAGWADAASCHFKSKLDERIEHDAEKLEVLWSHALVEVPIPPPHIYSGSRRP
jgi:hypothetical protein